MMSILSFLLSLFLTFAILIVALVLIGVSRMRAMLGGKNQRGQYQQNGGNPFGSQEGQTQDSYKGYQNSKKKQGKQSTQGGNSQPKDSHKKIFSQGEGEYVEFEEVEE